MNYKLFYLNQFVLIQQLILTTKRQYVEIESALIKLTNYYN